jgi:hypothetical protein
MIEPQPGQRGVIGAQHGLQRLTDTLEALNQGGPSNRREIRSSRPNSLA